MSTQSWDQILPLLKEGDTVEITGGVFKDLIGTVAYVAKEAVGVNLEVATGLVFSEFTAEFRKSGIENILAIKEKIRPTLKNIRQQLTDCIYELSDYYDSSNYSMVTYVQSLDTLCSEVDALLEK
jgi:ribosome recycling factor